MKLSMFFALVLSFASSAWAVEVEKVRTYRDGEVFVTELITVGAWNEAEASVGMGGGIVSVKIPQASLAKGKFLARPEDRLVKSVTLASGTEGELNTTVILRDGFVAKSLEGKVRVHKRGDNVLTIEVEGDAEKGRVAKGETIEMHPTAVVFGDGDDAAINSKLIVDGSKNAPAAGAEQAAGAEAGAASGTTASADSLPAEKKLDTSKLSESEIPVLASAKNEKKASGFDFQRVIVTLGVLATILGGAVMGLKRWAAKSANKAASQTKIKVLTQHHLGPKKSLAIIQVAGESLLIGVTDHNISMLKTLSLLDEEIPETVPDNFGRTLADFDGEEGDGIEVDAAPAGRKGRGRAAVSREADPEEDFAMRGLSEIRDVVSTKLKGFRKF